VCMISLQQLYEYFCRRKFHMEFGGEFAQSGPGEISKLPLEFHSYFWRETIAFIDTHSRIILFRELPLI
jgi:hypothetical protein